jgi:uncharacterized membrane protein (DUF485 family)
MATVPTGDPGKREGSNPARPHRQIITILVGCFGGAYLIGFIVLFVMSWLQGRATTSEDILNVLMGIGAFTVIAILGIVYVLKARR